MTVTVDVISGKKSVLAYIMKPFIKTQTESRMVSDAPVAAEDAPSVEPDGGEDGS